LWYESLTHELPSQSLASCFGGLITDRDRNNKSGLPFLVPIPLIKHLVSSTNNAKERREMMLFVQPRILPDSTSHMPEQACFGDYSANFDDAAQFAGMPDTIVPWATPAEADKPTALLPPPATVEAEPKKGSLER
jgi:general secretion pathway protein D